MRRAKSVVTLILFVWCVMNLAPSYAQLPQATTDALHPAQGSAACSTTETSSCAEAAAKILPQVMGDRKSTRLNSSH